MGYEKKSLELATSAIYHYSVLAFSFPDTSKLLTDPSQYGVLAMHLGFESLIGGA